MSLINQSNDIIYTLFNYIKKSYRYINRNRKENCFSNNITKINTYTHMNLYAYIYVYIYRHIHTNIYIGFVRY